MRVAAQLAVIAVQPGNNPSRSARGMLWRDWTACLVDCTQRALAQPSERVHYFALGGPPAQTAVAAVCRLPEQQERSAGPGALQNSSRVVLATAIAFCSGWRGPSERACSRFSALQTLPAVQLCSLARGQTERRAPSMRSQRLCLRGAGLPRGDVIMSGYCNCAPLLQSRLLLRPFLDDLHHVSLVSYTAHCLHPNSVCPLGGIFCMRGSYIIPSG